MNKNLLKSILLIITYTVFLVLALLKFDVLWGFLSQALAAMRPFYLGFAIAFVLTRPCLFFDRLYQRVLPKKSADRLSRPLAVTTAYLALILAIALLFALVLPQVAHSIALFAEGLGGYIANFQHLVNDLLAYFDQEAFDFTGLSSHLRTVLDKAMTALTDTLSQVMAITSSLISVVVTLTLSIVFSIYMLAGREKLSNQCARLLRAYAPARYVDPIIRVAELTGRTFTSFVSGQLTEACILGALCALGMLFIQADYAPLIGVIVGASALVPVVGAYAGAGLSAFLLVMISPIRALIFLVFLGILQQIEGNVIYPRVVGTSIGLPGIWVLTAVTLGGGLFGLPGVLLSVPTASVLYTLLKEDVTARLKPQKPEPDESSEA